MRIRVSTHENPAAMPLAQLTAPWVPALDELMDRADNAPQMAALSRRFGYVPIIDPNPRKGRQATALAC